MPVTLRLKAVIYLSPLILAACGNPTPTVAPSGSTPSPSCRSISNDEEVTLLANVAKLEIGDSEAKMRSLLGDPGDGDHGIAKPSGRITSTEYMYFVKKCGGGQHAGWDDDYVRLTFGTEGRLELIEGIRVPGVVTRHIPFAPPVN